MPFPTVVISYADGSTRTVSRDTLDADWTALLDQIVAIRFLPENRVQLYGDRFWAYLEGPNGVVIGARKPAQDVGTPHAVPEHITELTFDRQGRWAARYPATIPPGAVVRRSAP